jgi:hypothetical protein
MTQAVCGVLLTGSVDGVHDRPARRQWNGAFSATSGKITVQLPSWATTAGGTYDSSGFWVAGTGSPSTATIQ